ncbi:MAG: MFS transporter [Dehalococcoidia bacterium]
MMSDRTTSEAASAVVAPERRRFLAKPSIQITTFSSLRHRDYALLWSGILFTSSGMWMEQVALNWLVYDMTGSALALGLLNGLRAIPSLVTGLFGGVAADRMDRKRLMLSTQWMLLVLYAALGTLIVTKHIAVWHLMAFTFVTGVVWTFNQPVRQAILPSLVPREDLLNAVALQSSAFNVTRVLGPAIGGFLIAWIGAGGAIFAEAAAWVAVLFLTAAMRVPPAPPRQHQASVLRDLGEGVSYILRTQDIRALIALAFLPFVVIMPYMTMLTIFARDIFQMDAAGLGLMMSISGIGALAATLGVASLGNFRGKGKILMVTSLAMPVTLIAFAASRSMPISYTMLILVSAASMAHLALTNTLINLIVPNQFRGRVMSVYMLDRGLQPLGSLLAGGIAAVWGAQWSLGFMGALGLVLALGAIAVFPNVRRIE